MNTLEPIMPANLYKQQACATSILSRRLSAMIGLDNQDGCPTVGVVNAQ